MSKQVKGVKQTPADRARARAVKAEWKKLADAYRRACDVSEKALTTLMRFERRHQAHIFPMSFSLRPRKQQTLFRDERIWFPLDVASLATSAAMQQVVREFACSYAFSPCRRGTARRIQAEITISSYLQKMVPKRFRVRRCIISSEGDALVEAAKMYARVYAEDEKRGGETTDQRDERLAKEGQPRPMLRNRDSGPYIWGHDIGDLTFETMTVRWTGKNRCKISFGIGS